MVFPSGIRPRLWRDAKRVGLWLLWSGLGAGIFATVFALSFLMAMRMEMRSTQVVVPALAGRTLDEAASAVEPLRLVLQVAEERHDPRVPSGRILEQTPQAGASVRQGRKVKLILSLGGRVLLVPDLIGQPARAVRIQLEREGLSPGEQASVASDAAPAGRVIAQVPPSGSSAVPHSRVHQLVSSGPRRDAWVMPDLTGLPRQEAERWIEGSGFRRGAVRQVRGRGAAGSVVGQMPLAGYPVHPRDIVDLAIAD